MSSSHSSLLRYEGCNFLRQRLVLATLSNRSIEILKIREDEEEPGLREFEASFIRLLDKLTNGSKIQVNVTGTSIYYKPGLLEGGTIDHDCSQQRSIGYYLESIIMLAPFAKYPLKITLKGVTSGPDDPSADYYRLCVLPLLKKILPGDELDLKVHQRGVWPEGRGEVYFSCPIVRRIPPLWMDEESKVKRIRGLAYCVKVNPGMANRMVDSARIVLNKYLPDVYIYTDCSSKGANCSSGYGLVLVSESLNGITHAVEGCQTGSHSETGSQPCLPEDIGQDTALKLIEEIVKGGVIDSGAQCIPLLYMALTHRDVSKIKCGSLTPYTIQFLRHMADFFNVVYKLESKDEEKDSDIVRETVLLSCVGLGYANVNKSTK